MAQGLLELETRRPRREYRTRVVHWGQTPGVQPPHGALTPTDSPLSGAPAHSRKRDQINRFNINVDVDIDI